ncbi:MAG: hypothetical protein KDI69_07090, partial [Xanthomonadales bacterium]|nr:hypothetical protein [Xanthomonadales bacterium]
LGVSANGGQLLTGDQGSAANTVLTATEGVPLSIDLAVRDLELDAVHWEVDGLPAGMTLSPSSGSDGQASVRLSWTPSMLAANIGSGKYLFTVKAKDGNATLSHVIEVRVDNVNRAPQVLPMPTQLVREGETLGFVVTAFDADSDATRIRLIRDENTPLNAYFNPNNGAFEWTPSYGTVDNAVENVRPFRFTLEVTDGSLTSLRELEVRVLDTNRPPVIDAASHQYLVGQDVSLAIERFANAAAWEARGDVAGLAIHDADGEAQSAALTVSFSNLPEGALYDATNGVLRWVPGPGQVGDHLVRATVFDGRNSRETQFVLRVAADAEGLAPKVHVEFTPSGVVLPGQTVLTTVRADSFSRVASVVAEMQGADGSWTALTIGSDGRVRLTPATPGLHAIRVTATDVDGFQTQKIVTLKVRDPQDTTGPILAWQGALAGANALSAPRTLQGLTTIAAGISDLQLMHHELRLLPVGSGNSAVLSSADLDAASVDGRINFAALDANAYLPGVYVLTLSATDLAGRTSEISTRVVLDGDGSSRQPHAATDAVFTLGGHALALTRELETQSNGPSANDSTFGNWSLSLLSTQITHDQPAGEAWIAGARVWVNMPIDLGVASATNATHRFTLSTTAMTTPGLLRPVFDGPAGWNLEALNERGQPVTLRQQGQRLIDGDTGLPWQPVGYRLTGPDGTQYTLNAQGTMQSVSFTDGVRWLISDAG